MAGAGDGGGGGGETKGIARSTVAEIRRNYVVIPPDPSIWPGVDLQKPFKDQVLLSVSTVASSQKGPTTKSVGKISVTTYK